MYSGDWERGRPRGKSWAPVIVWGLIGLLLTAVAVNMLLAGTGVVYDSSEPRGTRSIFESFAWLAGAVVCALLAVHYEHRARGLPHGKISTSMEDAVRSHLPAGRAYLPSGRGVFRRHGPHSALAAGIILTVAGTGLVVAAFVSHAEAAKSSYTQASGVSDLATVTNVDNKQSCGRHSCDYYAYVTVTLRTPVGGHASTVVNVPRNVSYSSGLTLPVLVDPKDPGYAELPGSPYETNGDTAASALFAALTLLLGITGVVRGVRMRRRERAWKAARANVSA